MDNFNPRAGATWQTLTPRDYPMLGACGGQQQDMAAPAPGVTPDSSDCLTVGDDETTSSEWLSTDNTISDDRMPPVHFTSMHGWLHAMDGPRPLLQQSNLIEEFQAFREEIQAELQAQAQQIEGLIANSKNAGEMVVAERTYFSDQVSTLRAEGAQAFSLLQVQSESYESTLDSLRADFDNRIAAAQSMLASMVDHQVKQEVPKLLDRHLSHEVHHHMEHICAELLGHFDEALACEAAAHQQLERRILRKFDILSRPLQDKSRDKQKPAAMDDEESVVEQELPVVSSAFSSRGASTMCTTVPEACEAIDQTRTVPTDAFESLAMAGSVSSRNEGQHSRIRCGGKQRLLAAEFCLNGGSNFARPKCTAT